MYVYMYVKGNDSMITTKPLDLRSNLKKYMDSAFRGELVVISRPKNENVVMVSEKEYSDLIRAKQNAEYLEHLDRSREQLMQNQTISLSMDDLREMESDGWKPSQKIKDFMGHMDNE